MYCEELIAATEFARVTTLLCLLLTVVGVFGLSLPAQPGRGSQSEKYQRFSIIQRWVESSALLGRRTTAPS